MFLTVCASLISMTQAAFLAGTRVQYVIHRPADFDPLDTLEQTDNINGESISIGNYKGRDWIFDSGFFTGQEYRQISQRINQLYLEHQLPADSRAFIQKNLPVQLYSQTLSYNNSPADFLNKVPFCGTEVKNIRIFIIDGLINPSLPEFQNIQINITNLRPSNTITSNHCAIAEGNIRAKITQSNGTLLFSFGAGRKLFTLNNTEQAQLIAFSLANNKPVKYVGAMRCDVG